MKIVTLGVSLRSASKKRVACALTGQGELPPVRARLVERDVKSMRGDVAALIEWCAWHLLSLQRRAGGAA